MGVKSAALRGTFSKYAELVKAHFGLEVWISHVRTDDYPDDNYWEMLKLFPPETTVAYLKLPGAKSEFNRWIMQNSERDDKDFFIESGYAMDVQLPRPLTAALRCRFKRMMKMLDLRPSVHDTQFGMTLAADDEPSEEYMPSTTQWPRLMLLTRCTTRSDEEP